MLISSRTDFSLCVLMCSANRKLLVSWQTSIGLLAFLDTGMNWISEIRKYMNRNKTQISIYSNTYHIHELPHNRRVCGPTWGSCNTSVGHRVCLMHTELNLGLPTLKNWQFLSNYVSQHILKSYQYVIANIF